MREILLTNGMTTKVSDEDYDWLMQWRWRIYRNKAGNLYARTTSKPEQKMHRVILKAQPGEIVDHRNGDSLDNQRHNIRTCTASQNQKNKRINSRSTSGYKGVAWSKTARRWLVRIRINYQWIYLASVKDPYEGAHIYDQFAIQLNGEFASTNFQGYD